MNYRNILLFILSASFIATFMSCNKGRATQSSAVHVQRQTKKVIYPSPKDSVTNRHQISLVPSNTWIYNYNDGYFPCDTTCDLVLKGFAVDTNQHFYILGGNPTYIALYQDTILLKKMFLGTHLDDSYDALMQITNDSIYYIDEQNKIVYSLNKELEGSVNSFNLPFDFEDSIVSGKMEHDSYYLLTQKKDSEGWKSENYTTWCLEYPNIIKKILLLSAKNQKVSNNVSAVPINRYCGFIFQKVSPPLSSKSVASGGDDPDSASIFIQSFSGHSKKEYGFT